MSNPRVLFIGLDAGERDLLLQWSEAGHLPHIKSLLDRGLRGEAEVIPGFGSGAMWPSFATAVSPAKHGRYFGFSTAGGYSTAKRAQEIRSKPFWEVLSEQGKKVAVINVPYARLSDSLNGLQVLDWAIHNPVESRPVSLPEQLADEVVGKYGDDPVGPCDRQGLGQSDFRIFIDRLCDRVQSKTDMALEMLDRDQWDLFATVFDETHCVGHQTWHIHDHAHPDHDADTAAALGDPMLKVYQAIDAGIGRLLEQAGDDTQIMLASITGMGANYTANWILEDMLRSYEGEPKSAGLSALSMVRGVWRTLPEGLRQSIKRGTGSAAEKTSAMERRQRAAFTLPHNDISGVVRVNLKGREPEGVIEPENYQSYLDGLVDYLKTFKNAETGEPLIKHVVEPRKFMTGKHLEDMPDLLLEWNRSAPIRIVESPKTGRLQNSYEGNRLGDHTVHGLLVMAGQSMGSGSLAEKASVMDLAPTLCAMLGVDMPGDLDGKVIAEAATSPSQAESEPALS
ncbi:MAG: hypothetical protein CMN28_05035 [Salinisphaeraceae bacterium]|nr:hypothetical protein [Salinisphaeraceae bacterium]